MNLDRYDSNCQFIDYWENLFYNFFTMGYQLIPKNSYWFHLRSSNLYQHHLYAAIKPTTALGCVSYDNSQGIRRNTEVTFTTFIRWLSASDLLPFNPFAGYWDKHM